MKFETSNYSSLCFLFLCQGCDTQDPDPETFVTTEDPTLRLKWVAFLESTQHHVAGDLTWDKVGPLMY